MYIGKFKDIIPFDKQEQDKYINRLDEILTTGRDHSYTNFEICALRTIRAMQQEIAAQSVTIESQATQIAELREKIYQPGNCYVCKTSMANEEMELRHETDMEEIEQLQAQAQLEKCREALQISNDFMVHYVNDKTLKVITDALETIAKDSE
jgi:hypothetical protein